MTRTRIPGGAITAVILLFCICLAGLHAPRGQEGGIGAEGSAASGASEARRDLLYGRLTTHGGDIYEGRLRWGGDEEAFWGHYFNGFKQVNPWVVHVPPEHRTERWPLEIFGIEITLWEGQVDHRRPFMARFGDITRIEAKGRDLRVTLKSGTVFHLDRFAADDFADGIRIWDDRRGVVDLDEWRIFSVDLLPSPAIDAVPGRLHGTVRTPRGDFTGFVQWDRKESDGADELDGHAVDGKIALRFDTIRSIARSARDSSLVTLLDGRTMVLSGTHEVGHGNRGIYVDDRRYGRVLISWDAFERIDFTPGGSGPAYEDFPPGLPLTGTVTTIDGRSLAGRLVFDLDESETTETLDAPAQGVNYTTPFGMISSIVAAGPEERAARHARVTLHSGEELLLERSGDLGEKNAGMLIFFEGRERPDYVPWAEVRQVDLEAPPATSPQARGP